jgi:hypothetical protein
VKAQLFTRSADGLQAWPTVHQAWVYVVYHYIEMPVKRLARRIAYSGHWSY